ncbi:MAG: choice-of-anchor tandem repeat GloVer-containing protein [Candidatus Korobacteraceae bacterium]|jgi:hypothetical protein
MHSQSRFLNSWFRTVSFAVIAALVMMLAMVPAWAQNSVAPTAVQAAKMPELESQLPYPVKTQDTPKSAEFGRAGMHRRPQDNNDIYDNGPMGNQNAWTINEGGVVTNTFRILTDNTPITGMSFYAWMFYGDTQLSAEVSISSSPWGGGDRYFDQTETFTQGYCYYRGYGMNVCDETATFNGPTLNNGTYWLTLQNAKSNNDPVNWDQNSGDGCQSLGCPSLAMTNWGEVGTIPSESFTILGNATTTTTLQGSDYACPSAQNGFQDLYDFAATGGPSGVAIDRAGRLYGTMANGGSYGAGLLYDLTQKAGNWIYNILYDFLGGSNGNSPNGVIVGPSGALFGAATGGENSLGLIYEARPSPGPCFTALCSWNETTIYQFGSRWDELGRPTTFDSAGNLYGISAGGGPGESPGSVFELTPSSGGWTENLLTTFNDGSQGVDPTSLLLGYDGNLYGTAGGGDGMYGIVFQLVPSGSGWWLNGVYQFTGRTDGYSPTGLVQDSLGNLYGFSMCWQDSYTNYCGGGVSGNEYGLIFKLTPAGGGWNFSVIYSNAQDCGGTQATFHGLTIRGLGNLFAAEGGSDYTCTNGSCYQNNCGKVIAVPSGTPLVSGNADIFANITSDKNGNLYGATSTCGSSSGTDGMIWQYSP